MSKLKSGWRPAVMGSAFGLLLGFAGGAGAGLVDESPLGLPTQLPAESASPLESLTPTPTPTHTPPAAFAPPSSSQASSGSKSAGAIFGPGKASATCGKSSARLVRFRVLVERGLPTTPARFVEDVLSILCDERSWIGSGKVRFRYDPDGPLLIGLRTPDSSERRCMQLIGLSVNHYYSCASRSEVVLNSDRWFKGSRYWPGPVPVYRQMLVNHEVGHTQGQRHRGCPKDGNPAPVMMQQSKGVTTGSYTCKPNAWPLGYEKRSLAS